MDPLSDVLSLLKLRSYMCGGFDMAGEWSVRFEQHEGIKCYAIVSGQCWLALDGIPEPVRLETGDCFLLPRGRPFSLSSDPVLTPINVHEAFPIPLNGGIVTHNGGGECFGVGGFFALTGKQADFLLGELPPIVHIRKESDKAMLRGSLDQLMHELRDPQPGGLVVAQHLAYTLLVQALRLHLANGSRCGVGWLFALADKQISAAINSMHNTPAHRWTLQQLAECAGMSRSTFALKFKQTVGDSPMEYLTRWRMFLAGDKLTNSADPISAIAAALGYESESAFSTAFKRVMGCSPRQYTRNQNPSSPSPSQIEEVAIPTNHHLEPIAG